MEPEEALNLISGGSSPEELTAPDVLGALTGSREDMTPRRWNISRPCYDKPRRCPGWAGGGTRYARVRRCESGYIDYYWHDAPECSRAKRFWSFRFNQCPKCGVRILPYAVRWLDWRYVWGWKIVMPARSFPSDFRHWACHEFSWWDEETGQWAGWAGPWEIVKRLPGALAGQVRREFRYRITRFMIMHGIGDKP